MSLPVSLSEILSAGKFTIVTDDRVYKNQLFLSVEGNVLQTKSFVKVSLSRVRLFYFQEIGRVKHSGRFGRFLKVPVRYRGREKLILGRVITENRRWVLLEVASVFFLVPKDQDQRC